MKRKLVALLSATALVIVACKPSAGGTCTENSKSCDSPTARFACVTGKYVLETCKGVDGCKETPTGTTCDSSKGDVGDPCSSANQVVCGMDNKSKLRCEVEGGVGKLAFVSRCSKDGCSVDDKGGAHCNDPFAKIGDPCKINPAQNERANGACNEDFKSELRCKDGKMALTHSCRGDEGCTPLTTGPWCDRSIALAGDGCDANMPEFSVGCEPAHDKMLTCKGGKLTNEVRCGGEGKCYVRQYGQDGFSHYQAECDQSSALPGDECVKEGGKACSEDKESRLLCQGGKFVVEKACKMNIKHKKDEPDLSGCIIHAPDGSSFSCQDVK